LVVLFGSGLCIHSCVSALALFSDFHTQKRRQKKPKEGVVLQGPFGFSSRLFAEKIREREKREGEEKGGNATGIPSLSTP